MKRILSIVAVLLLVTVIVCFSVPSLKYNIIECEHPQWDEARCTQCGAICGHEEFADGICNQCGYTCIHPEFKEGQCLTCGYQCDHQQYDNGICVVCGTECPHVTFLRGKCPVCGYICEHETYSNGRCQVCGNKCRHELYIDGKCAECHDECAHGHYTNGTCDICRALCVHDQGWTETGSCSVCGVMCKHPEWEEGRCAVCRVECEHPTYSNCTCEICGTECLHPIWKEGACIDCGIACEHESFDRGICMICGEPCRHPVHNAAGQCLVCSRFVTHEFRNGLCITCGKPLMFLQDAPPVDIFASVPERGTTEYVYYDSIQYETGTPITKRMHVYLPYGYKEGTAVGKRYKLILLMPGLGDTEEKFFEYPHEYQNGTSGKLTEMFDYCIYTGVCEPVIAVSLSWEDGSGQEAAQMRDVKQVGMEIREVILPFLADRYSLYADNGSEKELIENREYVAYYGLSYGALMANRAVIPYEYDMVGSYCVAATASDNMDWAIDSIQTQGFPMYLYMCGYSSDEISKPTTHDCYAKLLDKCPQFVQGGVNAFEIELNELGHTSDMFDAMLYNYLQVVFRS